MRRFSADYLESTRSGMWADSREALSDLELGECQRMLDVGCGTGELTRVLREESNGDVVGLDADADLLASVPGPTVRGDATRLPFVDDSFDLVVCQALLINLPDPVAAVREFARVASDRVAAVEPNNGAVTVQSTVDSEPRLARRARSRFLDGVDTNVELGADAADVFGELARIAGTLLVTVENEGDDPPPDKVEVNYVRDDVPLYCRNWKRVFTDLGLVEVDAAETERDTLRAFRADRG